MSSNNIFLPQNLTQSARIIKVDGQCYKHIGATNNASPTTFNEIEIFMGSDAEKDCLFQDVAQSSGLSNEFSQLSPKIKPSPANNFALVGFFVAMEGDLVVLGSEENEEAYISERSGSNFGSATALPSPTPLNDTYGASVAVYEDFVFVGDPTDNPFVDTPAVYVYQKDSAGNWTEVQQINHPFGSNWGVFASDMTVDNDRLFIVGDNGNNDLQSVYVYNLNGSTWDYFQKLDVDANDDIVDLKSGNQFLIVSTFKTDCEIFEANISGIYSLLHTIDPPSSRTSEWGGKIATFDGEYIAISDKDFNSNTGIIDIYKKNNNVWNLHQSIEESILSTNDELGAYLDMGIDFIVAYAQNSPNPPLLFIYRLNSNSWTLSQEITLPSYYSSVSTSGPSFSNVSKFTLIEASKISQDFVLGDPENDETANDSGGARVFNE